MRKAINRIVMLSLVLVLAVSVIPAFGSIEAFAAGASVSNVRFSKSSVNTTTKSKIVKLRMKVKESSQASTVYVEISNGKSYKYSYLNLESGDNRNGTWMAEVYFSNLDKGKWKVVAIYVRSQRTSSAWSYQKKSKKGIGGKVKVVVGPKSSIKLSVPQKAQSGQAITLKATVKSKKKAVKKSKVYFYVNYYDSNYVYKALKYSVKTNKKGIATKKITMPATYNGESLGVYAEYRGKSNKIQPSYSTYKYVSRIYYRTSIDNLTGRWDGNIGSNVTLSARLTTDSGSPIANKTVKFVATNYYGGATVVNASAKTNASGIATITFAAREDDYDLNVDASFADDGVYGASSESRNIYGSGWYE